MEITEFAPAGARVSGRKENGGVLSTVNDLYLELRRTFKQAGLPMPELEARELTAAVCRADKKRTADWAWRYLDGETIESARALAGRRLDGEPLAYLLGEWDFFGLTFTVSPAVLIPRADTERLCELAVERARQSEAPRVLDLCCGSGCIGLALLHEVGDARLVAADLSEDALRVARENAWRLGLSARVMFTQADALAAPDPRLRGFSVFMCNPPYITAEEMEELDRDVAEFEPHLALYGGEDGLDFYRALAAGWMEVLVPGGTAYFECGWKQAHDVAALFAQAGWTDVAIETDYAGVERIVVAHRPDEASGETEAPDGENAPA